MKVREWFLRVLAVEEKKPKIVFLRPEKKPEEGVDSSSLERSLRCCGFSSFLFSF